MAYHPTKDTWTLYFHKLDENSWRPASFIVVDDKIDSLEHYWALMYSLGTHTMSHGMFFLMRSGVPPLWEHHANHKGGTYSMLIQGDRAMSTWVSYSSAIIGESLLSAPDVANGISINPKTRFCILKIWNREFSVAAPEKVPLLAGVPAGAINYTRNDERPM